MYTRWGGTNRNHDSAPRFYCVSKSFYSRFYFSTPLKVNFSTMFFTATSESFYLVFTTPVSKLDSRFYVQWYEFHFSTIYVCVYVYMSHTQGGMGGSSPPPPSSGVYDFMLPLPHPSYYNYMHAHASLNLSALDLLCCRANCKELWSLHDGAYLAQCLLAQGCSLISSSRDRGCHLAMKRNLNECGSGKKRCTYLPTIQLFAW